MENKVVIALTDIRAISAQIYSVNAVRISEIAEEALPLARAQAEVVEAAKDVSTTFLRGSVRPYEYERLCNAVDKLQQLEKQEK